MLVPDEKKRRLRIYFSSNSSWSPSGYGQQISYLAPLIRDAGFELAMGDFFGLEGGSIEYDGIKQYSKIDHAYGEDGIILHANDFNADVVMTLQDIWVLNPDVLNKVKNWIPFVPIDHDPIPPVIFDRLRIAYRIVTMSEFGAKQLSDRGMHSTQIPHFVDTDIFKPMNKAESKKMLTIPEDYYVFGMVSANKENPPRKSFQEAMDAFKLFHDKHPKSCMYFHTYLNQPGGFDIETYSRFLGINGSVYKIDLYQQRFKCDKNAMAKIFNAFDVLLMPSTNEGFGIPAIEAQSCGVPVITNDFTSMPELIIPGKTGELCKVLYKRFTPLGSYIGQPDHKSIYDAMEKIYKGDWNAYSKAAREHVLNKYELKKVWNEKWLPFLLKVEQEIIG